MPTTPETIGTYMRRARRARDMTQADVAKLLKVAPNTLRAWERGSSSPPVDVLPLWAAVVGLSEDERGEVAALVLGESAP